MRHIARLLAAIVAIAILAVVFFDWRRHAREVRAAADVAPRGGTFVAAHDVKVFVQQAGDRGAPAVVLVHGTGTWSEIWRETIDVLAPRYHVIAIDLPPFGYSDKPRGSASYTPDLQARRILGVLDSLHVASATLVGHSVGARPVVAAALLSPPRIERLILVDPALGFDTVPPSFLASGVFKARPLRNAVLSTYGTNPLFLRRLFRSFVPNQDAVTDARIAVIEKPMVIAGTTEAYGDWLQCLMFSDATELAHVDELRMPVHLIWGRTDRVTPLWQGVALQEKIPGAKLVILDRVGHIPYIEDPPSFHRALLASLSSPP